MGMSSTRSTAAESREEYVELATIHDKLSTYIIGLDPGTQDPGADFDAYVREKIHNILNSPAWAAGTRATDPTSSLRPWRIACET